MPSLLDILNYLKAPTPVHGQKQINPTMKAGRDAATNYMMNMSQNLGEDLGNTVKHPEQMTPMPGNLGGGMLGAYRLSPIGRSYPTVKDYDILNEGAGKVGDLYTGYDPEKKNVHIDAMRSFLPSPPGMASPTNSQGFSFGPNKVQEVLEQLFIKGYPQAKTFSAMRSSGARAMRGGNADSSYLKRAIPGRENLPPLEDE